MRSMTQLSEAERKALYIETIRNWNTMTVKGIAEKFNVKPYVIGTIACRIRKAGIPLPKKIFTFIDDNFKAELMKAFQEA